jgi:hypothetical protein
VHGNKKSRQSSPGQGSTSVERNRGDSLLARSRRGSSPNPRPSRSLPCLLSVNKRRPDNIEAFCGERVLLSPQSPNPWTVLLFTRATM